MFLVIDDLYREKCIKEIFTFCGVRTFCIKSSSFKDGLLSEYKWKGCFTGDLISNRNDTDVLHSLSISDIPVIYFGNSCSRIGNLNSFSAIIHGDLSYATLKSAINFCIKNNIHISRKNLGDINDGPLTGNSYLVNRVNELTKIVSSKSTTVLIRGETGTGKGLVASRIHYNSNRRHQPFITINCGAIPSGMLESELFGHEKGAFTNAIVQRKGACELANNGTLFLDEIGDMPMEMQVKLLRFIQEGNFNRVGGEKLINVDVRIISATHRDLEAMVANGEFREDLYYRLNIFPIETPSIKDRPSDIQFLINDLICKSREINLSFTKSALYSLCKHSWPGNVRELNNLLERLSILHPNKAISINLLPEKYQYQDCNITSIYKSVDNQHLKISNGIVLKSLIDSIEKYYIKLALIESDGIVADAATMLTLSRTTLIGKINKYGLNK